MRRGAPFFVSIALAHLAACNAYDRAHYGELVDGALRDGTPDVPAGDRALDTAQDAAVDSGVDAARDDADAGAGDAADVLASDTDACTAMPETCNGRDDDCDGVVDNGFDLASDDANCGTCGHACLLPHSAAMCTAGQCIPTCVSGWADCDGDATNGCEADLSLPSHCGRCGHVCATSSATCDAGGACSDEYAAEIEAAGSVSCARRINGTVWCWGHNVEGVVGDGTLVDRSVPTEVTGLRDVVALTGSDHHKCALRADHTVWCWGSNESGALGDGTTVMRPAPVQVTGLTDARWIRSGRHHVCASRTDGTLWCWGQNGEMQLAEGTTNSRYTPVATTGTSGLTALDSYGYTNCALSATNVLCWGRNTSGETGNGTMVSPQPMPIAVTGLTDAVELGVLYTAACARRSTGHVVCWGADNYGQMGDGTRGTTLRLAPAAEVNGITDAIAVTGGQYHACVLHAAGTVSCWGLNSSGELGNASTSTSPSPVTTMGIANVAQLSAGDDHTCALLRDGTVHCWGNNLYGQLGDGTMVNRATPVLVQGIP